LTSVDRRLPPGFLEQELRADARGGLTSQPKSLPPKWFYDAQGSALFEKITELPEYYPTRAEREILHATAAQVAGRTRARTLIELGSGSSEKTRLLLDALRSAGTLRCYVPVDVSEPALVAAGAALSAEYPGLDVRAVASDFEEHLGFPAEGDAPAPRLVAFLGSTIGNLVPEQRASFLARVRAGLGTGDFFLLGTDLVKDPATLVAAYDDDSGVTAEFNKNVLAVLNTELGADFDRDEFEHVAVWNADTEWIEMRLRSLEAQTVHLPAIGLTVSFAAGEEMRTEVSAKFRRTGVEAELAAAGFRMLSWWTDSAVQFGLSLSAPALPAGSSAARPPVRTGCVDGRIPARPPRTRHPSPPSRSGRYRSARRRATRPGPGPRAAGELAAPACCPAPSRPEKRPDAARYRRDMIHRGDRRRVIVHGAAPSEWVRFMPANRPSSRPP
jgi:L-histidine Nalpha-methyltransferase